MRNLRAIGAGGGALRILLRAPWVPRFRHPPVCWRLEQELLMGIERSGPLPSTPNPTRRRRRRGGPNSRWAATASSSLKRGLESASRKTAANYLGGQWRH